MTKIYKRYKKRSDRLVELLLSKKRHELFYANKNISFDLYVGETLGIIGLNGAGKSTLLKQIAGVINPTSGAIQKKGKVTALLELGTGFNYDLTGRENIYFNAMLLGMTKGEIKKKIDKIIDFSELDSFIDEPLKSYSSGMVMRLAFSIAIHTEPQVLIVDEALSVGDAYFSAKCTQALRQLKKKNLSIIYVSHDLNSLKILCDRLLLLHKGELIMDGDVESVINRYNYLIATFNQEDIQCAPKGYGNQRAIIQEVKMYGEDGEKKVFTSGEEVEISIKIQAKEDITDQNIGILIRDKFSQDIFGTNTYYHNKSISLQSNQKIEVKFKCRLNLGMGKYSLTAAIHSSSSHIEGCTYWVDDAFDFEIAGTKGPFFVGLCRLEPEIEIVV